MFILIKNAHLLGVLDLNIHILIGNRAVLDVTGHRGPVLEITERLTTANQYRTETTMNNTFHQRYVLFHGEADVYE